MYQAADRLVEAVETGRMTRREAVAKLVALAAAAFAGGIAPAETQAATFRSVGLNHIALRVTNLARSREFYRKHLGLEVLNESEHNCFMAAGTNNFMAMFRSKKPGLDHYCYTIEGYRPDEVTKKLQAAGLNPRRREDRVYFDDPDGIEVQLASTWGDYPGER